MSLVVASLDIKSLEHCSGCRRGSTFVKTVFSKGIKIKPGTSTFRDLLSYPSQLILCVESDIEDKPYGTKYIHNAVLFGGAIFQKWILRKNGPN
jgi:hypothetical protein